MSDGINPEPQLLNPEILGHQIIVGAAYELKPTSGTPSAHQLISKCTTLR